MICLKVPAIKFLLQIYGKYFGALLECTSLQILVPTVSAAVITPLLNIFLQCNFLLL